MRYICGRSGRARTRDPRFWRPMLYQLSYAPARLHLRLSDGLYLSFRQLFDDPDSPKKAPAVVVAGNAASRSSEYSPQSRF